MKAILIPRNNNYFRIIILIILVIFILYILSKFLLHPSKYTYFLMPTRNSVILFSIAGILTCLLVLYIILKNIFRKDAFLKIDEEGIFNGFSFYDKKNIRWSEISKIETIRYNYNNYLAIYLKETLNKEKGVSYLFFKINEKTMGTPYIITSGDLDCTFKYLEKSIQEAFVKYKH